MADVQVALHGGSATVTIDRPSARNAIGAATVRELGIALDRVEKSEARVLVLRGGGDRAFVSGGDLKELSLIRDKAGARGMATSARRLLDRLVCFPVPVVAALNGHALGGGAEVAVAADIRVAAEDIEIGFTQSTLGIMPAWGGAERLAEIVGRGRAIMLLASGSRLSASAAERMGLVDVVVPRQDFDASVAGVVESLASLTVEAARSIKSVVAAAKPHVHAESEQLAVDRFAQLWISDDHWNALARART